MSGVTADRAVIVCQTRPLRSTYIIDQIVHLDLDPQPSTIALYSLPPSPSHSRLLRLANGMSQTPSTLTRTVLLLGYGPRVSTGIKDHFLAQGYNITTVSRSARPELDGVDKLTHIVGDCSTLAAIDAAFKQTTKKYGPISTVIYNGQLRPSPADIHHALTLRPTLTSPGRFSPLLLTSHLSRLVPPPPGPRLALQLPRPSAPIRPRRALLVGLPRSSTAPRVQVRRSQALHRDREPISQGGPRLAGRVRTKSRKVGARHHD